jgi:hypothetical protein
MTKKVGLGLVFIVLLLGAYAAGSFNARKIISLPPAEWAAGSEGAQAWREFATSLEAAGARVFAASPDPVERLDGLQFLAQLASAALEMKLAKGSQVDPKFTDWMSDYRKFLGDSPDAIYHTAELSSEYRYEVSGNRGDAEYLGFMLYGRQINGWNRAAANISSETMRFDEEGNFTILLSSSAPEDPATNWLQLEDDTHMIMVRQYYHDRPGKTVASLAIRNLDTGAPEASTDQQLATRLRDATAFFNDTLDGAIALSDMLSQAPNSIEPPSGYSADFGGIFYPTSDNEYHGGWFDLAEDEALVIEGAVPDAPYWSISLQNRWMQSLDYEFHRTALNDKQIATQDGRYRVVVSHRQPDSGTWIDTAGRKSGLVAIRYQLSQGSEQPTLKLVKFKDL